MYVINLYHLGIITYTFLYMYICTSPRKSSTVRCDSGVAPIPNRNVMKVFYTASFYGKNKYQKYYDLVLKSIEAQGVELLSPEKGDYKAILKNKKLKSVDPETQHYEAIRQGILWADVVIIEISNQDFQLGHEATLAMVNKKPVLCLSLTTDYSRIIQNRHFHAAKYNQYNAKRLISDFIAKQRKELLSIRFNCFLSKSQIDYIEGMAKIKGMNKSEYLRELIDNDQRKESI